MRNVEQAVMFAIGLVLALALISVPVLVLKEAENAVQTTQDKMIPSSASQSEQTINESLTRTASEQETDSRFSIFKVKHWQWLLVIVGITMVPIIFKVAQYVITGSRENVTEPWSRSISDIEIGEDTANTQHSSPAPPPNVADALENMLSRSQTQPDSAPESSESSVEGAAATTSAWRVIRDNMENDQDETKTDEEPNGQIKRVIRG